MRRAALLLLALALLAPLASADHVFSHRVYVVGRVVDAQGVPVAGAPVAVDFLGPRISGRCFDSKDEATGPQGDFEVCRHTHAVPPGSRANVSIAGVNRTLEVDPDLRVATLHLQLEGPAPGTDLGGMREFNRTYVVAGRHFTRLAEPVAVEAVRVNATPIPGNVTVRVLAGGEELANATGVAGEHGEFRVDLPLGAVPAGAIVRVVSGRDAVEESASSLFRRSDVALVRDTTLDEGPGANAPGAGAGKVPLSPWIALAAITACAALARRARRR